MQLPQDVRHPPQASAHHDQPRQGDHPVQTHGLHGLQAHGRRLPQAQSPGLGLQIRQKKFRLRGARRVKIDAVAVQVPTIGHVWYVGGNYDELFRDLRDDCLSSVTSLTGRTVHVAATSLLTSWSRR